jgi:hypothetical protein
MIELQIDKTGNFWVDNGLVGLYKILESLKNKEVFNESGDPIDFDAALKPNCLEIKLSGVTDERDTSILHPDLISILNEAKKKVVTNYLTSTSGASWIYNSNNFEVYRKTDFKMHLKSFFTGKTPKTEGGLCIWPDKKKILSTLDKFNIPYQRDGGTITFADKKYKNKPDKNVTLPSLKQEDVKANDRLMNEEELIQFIDFLEVNSFLKVTDDSKPVSLTGRGFLNSSPKYDLGEEFLQDFLTKGNKRCAFSGELYSKADVISGMDFPFLTGKSGEMNFASHLESKPNISAKYAFVSLFSFHNLYYQLQNGLQNYFIFYDNNLKALNNFYNAIQPATSQLKNADYCNFETHIIGAEYENETLFGFIVSVYKQAKQKLSKDGRKELYTKNIITFTNDGNIFRDVKEYTSLTQLFNLFDAFDETGDEKFGFEHFLNMVRFFQKKIPSTQPKYDTTWRNRICADMLNFRSIVKTIEWFLGEVRLKEETPNGIIYLDKILQVYNNKTQFNMKPEMVEMCKSVGNRIGRYCREKEDKGILFSIRNAKNRTEFLNVLSESQFRTQVSYGEDFFKALPDTPEWEEYKALVSIFAMNSFLYKPNADNS